MNFTDDPEYAAKMKARIEHYSHPDIGGCRTWHRSKRGKGYAGLGTKWGQQKAHRVAYALAHGSLAKGQIVMHTCDNRLCVNPDHLCLGTHVENMADMRAKGRQARGEVQGKARLTVDAVRDIRTRRLSVAEFANLYGVSREAVYDARVGRYWKHVA